MNIGKQRKEYEDYTINELIEMGWTYLDLNSQLISSKHIDWFEKNLESHNEDANWLDGLSICFRKEEDAFHFKLRWL